MRGYHLLRTAWTIAADYLFDLFLEHYNWHSDF